MEFVALSDTVLRTLALEDPELRRVFHGVHPADQLPRSPTKSVRQAYIVNTDPAGEPGQHWFCLLYTSPSPRDRQKSRMPSSA